MRTVGTALEFRVELAGHEPGVIRDLYHLYNVVIRRSAGEDHAPIQQVRAIIIVHLIAVAVALIDHRGAVQAIGLGLRIQGAGVLTQAHGAAHVRYILLLRQNVDHRVGGGRVDLCRVGVCHAQHIPGKFNNGNLHTQADPQVGYSVGAGVAAGVDFAFYAAGAKAAGYQNAVHIA